MNKMDGYIIMALIPTIVLMVFSMHHGFVDTLILSVSAIIGFVLMNNYLEKQPSVRS